MSLQHLEDAARMLERRISLEFTCVTSFAAAVLAVSAASPGVARFLVSAIFVFLAGVEPCLRAVLLLLRIPAAEVAAQIFGIAKILAQDHGRVGVVANVLRKPEIILEDVIDHAADEDDVAAGTQRHPNVSHRRRARKTRINMDDLGAKFER